MPQRVFSFVFLVGVIVGGVYAIPSAVAAPVEEHTPLPLTILNPHEHPKKGDVWKVSFTTEGVGDLTITRNDPNTIIDLKYVSLTCGENVMYPEQRGSDSFFLADFTCNEDVSLSHEILKTGNHTLKFEYRGYVAFSYNSAGTWQWAKRFGGTGIDTFEDITTTSTDGLLVGGVFSGNGDVNGDGDSSDGGAESGTGYGVTDILIGSYTSTGVFQWAKRLGGTGYDYAAGLSTDENDRLIVTGLVTGNADMNGDGDSSDGGAESATGYGQEDVFVSVFNSSGTWQWAKRLGGTSGSEAGFGVAYDSQNNIIVAGRVQGNADMNGDGDSSDGGAESGTGYGQEDVFVSVFNASGTWQWAKRLGGTGGDAGYGVAIDSANSVIVNGYFTGAADVNGDGDTTDGGAESATGYGQADGFISVFNSSGTWQWAKRLGGATGDYGERITTDSNNRVIYLGQSIGAADVNGDGDSTDGGAESATGYGTYDHILSLFDSSGTWQWAKRLGNASSDQPGVIIADSQNSIYLGGRVTGDADLNGDGDSTDGGAESSTGYGSYDAFFTVFNSSGTWQWAKRLGGTNNDYLESITFDSSDNLIVTGLIRGDADVNGDGDRTDGGAESATGYGSDDAFISFFNAPDSVAPVISLTALTPDPTTDTTPNLTGTVTDASGTVSTVQYQVNGTGGSWSSCSANDSTFDESSEAFTCTVSPALTLGSYTVYVRATDNSANTTGSGSESSDAFAITETDGPTLSLTPLSPDPTTDSSPAISGTATDAESTISSVQFQLNGTGGSWTSCTATDGTFSGSAEEFVCSPSNLSPGTYTLYVRSTDSRSNVSSYSSDTFTVQSRAQASEDISLDLSEDSASSQLGVDTLVNTEEVTVEWERPSDISSIERYVLHYRERGSRRWKTTTKGADATSVDFEPGEGVFEWFLSVEYTDGSSKETKRYRGEIDHTAPELQTVNLLEHSLDGATSVIRLPFGSPLRLRVEQADGETIAELWNAEKTIRYATMACELGVCDHGHVLNGSLRLVLYVEDAAQNRSSEREIMVSPFGFSAPRTPSVQGITSQNVLPLSETIPPAPDAVGLPKPPDPTPSVVGMNEPTLPFAAPQESLVNRIMSRLMWWK